MADAAKQGWKILLSKANTNNYKLRFYPTLCQSIFNENYDRLEPSVRMLQDAGVPKVLLNLRSIML